MNLPAPRRGGYSLARNTYKCSKFSLPAVSRDLKLSLAQGAMSQLMWLSHRELRSRLADPARISALDRARAISETENLREAQADFTML